MTTPAPSGARVLLVGLAAGVLAPAAFAAGAFLGLPLDLPVATLTAAAALATAPLLAWLAAWAGVPRPGAAAAVAPTALAPLLLAGGGYHLSQPLVASHERCGTGEMALLLLAPFGFAVLGALGACVGVAWLGRERRSGDRLLRALSVGALGLFAALLAWSVARAARAPQPDDYVDSLPVVATVPPVSGAPVFRFPLQKGGSEEDLFITAVPGLELEVERRCSTEHCKFGLGRPGEAEVPLDGKRKYLEGGHARRDQALTLRRDEAHGFWVLEGSSRVAYREHDERLVLTDMDTRDVAGAVAPPWGWIAGALGGAALVGWLAARRRRALCELRRVEGATAGTLGEGGWITFEGAAPAVRAAPELGLPAGPVLVLMPEGGKAPAGAYRGEAALGAGQVTAGERADLAAQIRGRMARLDALTLATAALLAAPLAAAWLHLG